MENMGIVAETTDQSGWLSPLSRNIDLLPLNDLPTCRHFDIHSFFFRVSFSFSIRSFFHLSFLAPFFPPASLLTFFLSCFHSLFVSISQLNFFSSFSLSFLASICQKCGPTSAKSTGRTASCITQFHTAMQPTNQTDLLWLPEKSHCVTPADLLSFIPPFSCSSRPFLCSLLFFPSFSPFSFSNRHSPYQSPLILPWLLHSVIPSDHLALLPSSLSPLLAYLLLLLPLCLAFLFSFVMLTSLTPPASQITHRGQSCILWPVSHRWSCKQRPLWYSVSFPAHVLINILWTLHAKNIPQYIYLMYSWTSLTDVLRRHFCHGCSISKNLATALISASEYVAEVGNQVMLCRGI